MANHEGRITRYNVKGTIFRPAKWYIVNRTSYVTMLIIVGLGLSLFSAIDGYAQTLAKHNWYFGNTQSSIRFNRVTNVASLVTNKAVPFGVGGSATATDRGNGNVLFYTDGNTVYDANNVAMPNGGGL